MLALSKMKRKSHLMQIMYLKVALLHIISFIGFFFQNTVNHLFQHTLFTIDRFFKQNSRDMNAISSYLKHK